MSADDWKAGLREDAMRAAVAIVRCRERAILHGVTSALVSDGNRGYVQLDVALARAESIMRELYCLTGGGQ